MKKNIMLIIAMVFTMVFVGAAFATPNVSGMFQTVGTCETTVVDGCGKQNYGNGILYSRSDGTIAFCFDNGTYNAWITGCNAVINGQNYSFDSNGYGRLNNNASTWNTNNNNDYYYDNRYYSNNGWVQERSGWRYYQNGNYVTGWQSIGYDGRSCWFYFDPAGYMQTGWQELYYQGRNCWFYLGNDGIMRSNTTIDGYRIGSDGIADRNSSSSSRYYYGYNDYSYNNHGSINKNNSSTKTYCSYCGKKTYGMNMCMTCGYAKENYCQNGCDPTKNKYCRYCGRKFPSTSVNYCDRCHRSVDEDDKDNYKYCGNCGTRLKNNSSSRRRYW